MISYSRPPEISSGANCFIEYLKCGIEINISIITFKTNSTKIGKTCHTGAVRGITAVYRRDFPEGCLTTVSLAMLSLLLLSVHSRYSRELPAAIPGGVLNNGKPVNVVAFTAKCAFTI
jgi:hypothetical protein